MCHYLTAALPESADLPKLRPLLKAHRQVLRPAVNAWVQAQLPPGAQYLSCTSKHCDCGTAVGWSAYHEQRLPPPDDAEKLRRKGWSEARIQRRLEERERAVEKSNLARSEGTPREEAERWAAYIRAVLGSGEAAWFGLLLHWYCGNVETERIRIRETIAVPPNRLDADTVLRVSEDAFYRFQR